MVEVVLHGQKPGLGQPQLGHLGEGNITDVSRGITRYNLIQILKLFYYDGPK